MTHAALAGVVTGSGEGFAPCTAQAVMEMLDYYAISLRGKNVAVLGRSLVIGRPVAMLLMARDATVTLCHSATVDAAAICRRADIIVAAAGVMELVGAEYVSPGQAVMDVGIHWNEAQGRLCGDVRFDDVRDIVDSITPVPGGVGAVTSAILALHTAQAAERLKKKD